MGCKTACKPLLNRDELRHRITIQQVTNTKTDGGNYSSVWTLFAEVWASIKPSSGLKKFRSDKEETQYTHKIRMAYQPDITTAHRILFGERVFEIEEVLNLEERNIALELRCTEGTTE